jgi:hypothetical protein
MALKSQAAWPLCAASSEVPRRLHAALALPADGLIATPVVNGRGNPIGVCYPCHGALPLRPATAGPAVVAKIETER